MTTVRPNKVNQIVGRPMGGIKGDDQPVFRFAFCKIDAWVMIELLNKGLPLALGEVFDYLFTTKQKLLLVCCFMGIDHGFAYLSLFALPLSQHPKLNCY